MIKRVVDILVSASAMLLLSPILAVVLLLVWRQDRHSPFYLARRIGKEGLPFRMVKIRSMRVNADMSPVVSTATNDQRITPVGAFVRRFKLDEVSQLWNVLKGDMSLVGPRPTVELDVLLYTPKEKELLQLRPGITDPASIVFSDEAQIITGADDPDLAYMNLIRPQKNALSLFYAERRTLITDLKVLYCTLRSIVDRPGALRSVVEILIMMGAPAELVEVARRDALLVVAPPPGSNTPIGAEALAQAREILATRLAAGLHGDRLTGRGGSFGS